MQDEMLALLRAAGWRVIDRYKSGTAHLSNDVFVGRVSRLGAFQVMRKAFLPSDFEDEENEG